MSALLSGLPALLLAGALCVGLGRKTDVYAAFTAGVTEALPLLGRILSALIALLPEVEMLRSSGALEALTGLLSPVLRALGIPPETGILLLLRPMSGSAALALGGELMGRFGPDSAVGRTAAVMLGSTETTFYVIGVYFGAAGIRRAKRVLPAALAADLTAFLAAAWSVRLLWP